jgi:hypothetical protein
MAKASENKFLIVKSGVILTPVIEPVIVALDKYFEAANKKALVTSGLRNPESQLEIIRGYIQSKGLKAQFPEMFTLGVKDKITVAPYGSIYAWQLGWSKLLNLGVIINPCLAAPVLMDYIRNGVNKKGQVIQGSPHFAGMAFDIGGQGNGINDELAVIQTALADKCPGLVDFLAEHENNAVHCDCKSIVTLK